MDISSLGFDPARYTSAPQQTEGWIRFDGPPQKAFDRIADHAGMTEWVPLLKHVTVDPKTLKDGGSAVGTVRTLVFEGGIWLEEKIVFWNPPLGYAYATTGKVFPLKDYVGVMAVEGGPPTGGTFHIREYFSLEGKIQEAILPHGVLQLGRQSLAKLSTLIEGTEFEFRHV